MMKVAFFIGVTVALIHVVSASYGYNITVSLAFNGAKPTTGKMSVYLSGPSFVHEVILQPHMTQIYVGMNYSFYTEAPIPFEMIDSAYFMWKRKILGNSGPNTLPLQKIIVQPLYILNPDRRLPKSFCPYAPNGHQDIKSHIKTILTSCY
jgi:hypothetical protein